MDSISENTLKVIAFGAGPLQLEECSSETQHDLHCYCLHTTLTTFSSETETGKGELLRLLKLSAGVILFFLFSCSRTMHLILKIKSSDKSWSMVAILALY